MIDWEARARACRAVRNGLAAADETCETLVSQVLEVPTDALRGERGAAKMTDVPQHHGRSTADWSSRQQASWVGKVGCNTADETDKTAVSSVLSVDLRQLPLKCDAHPGAGQRSAAAYDATDWIDPVPSGGRNILSLLDLQPMSTKELMHALDWRRGEVVRLLIRLRNMRATRLKGARWILTSEADRFALAARPKADPEASWVGWVGSLPGLVSGDAATAPSSVRSTTLRRDRHAVEQLADE